VSYFIPGKRKLAEKILPKEGLQLDAGYQIGKGLAPPKMPEIPAAPAPPTLDDAQSNRDQQDRLRRRRGVHANIYAGATGGGAKSTLGG